MYISVLQVNTQCYTCSRKKSYLLYSYKELTQTHTQALEQLSAKSLKGEISQCKDDFHLVHFQNTALPIHGKITREITSGQEVVELLLNFSWTEKGADSTYKVCSLTTTCSNGRSQFCQKLCPPLP